MAEWIKNSATTAIVSAITTIARVHTHPTPSPVRKLRPMQL